MFSNAFVTLYFFNVSLTHFSPVSHFYTPWKRQKTKGFLDWNGFIKIVDAVRNLQLSQLGVSKQVCH